MFTIIKTQKLNVNKKCDFFCTFSSGGKAGLTEERETSLPSADRLSRTIAQVGSVKISRKNKVENIVQTNRNRVF